MVPCLHQGNVYSKRKLRVWRAQKCNPLVGAKTHLPVRAGKLPRLMGGGYRAENGKLCKLGGPIGMVPCLHQGNIYIQKKLWVWREQKCIRLVGGETPLPCAGQQTTPFHGVGIGPRTETCVDWCGAIAMVPCLHQGNVYSKRKLRVWRAQKCNRLVGAKTPLTCEGRQTTPLMGSGVGQRTESCVNWGGPIAMVPSLHQGNVHIKIKLQVGIAQKCIPSVGAEISLTCAGHETTPTHGGLV